MGKGVNPYEHMDYWEKIIETSNNYIHLNMEDITDTDYAHAKKVCKNFEIKNVWEYYDLYDLYIMVYSNTLLSADVIENIRNICLNIHKLDSPKVFSAPKLGWQAALKNSKIKLNLLNNIDMLNGRQRYKITNVSLYLMICKS